LTRRSIVVYGVAPSPSAATTADKPAQASVVDRLL
jgi:hypothetical protein